MAMLTKRAFTGAMDQQKQEIYGRVERDSGVCQDDIYILSGYG